MRRSGFTLLELLIVIGIVALLATISIPIIGKINARSYASHCTNNLRQLGVALNLYLSDNNNRFPSLAAGRRSKDEDVDTIDTVLVDYVDDPKVFHCKADFGNFYEETGTSYLWNNTLNGQHVTKLNFLGIVDNRGGIPVLSDKENFHLNRGDEVNILYADGHTDQNVILRVE